MFAAVGLLLLIVAYGAFVIIALNQAYSDDGASGPLLGLSPWVLGLSGLLGCLALCLPSGAVSHEARLGAVGVQYAPAFAGPMPAGIDPPNSPETPLPAALGSRPGHQREMLSGPARRPRSAQKS